MTDDTQTYQQEQQQPAQEQNEQLRTTPQNELDLQLLLTENDWGKSVSTELYQKLKKDAWGVLNYYKRDIRLANLDSAELFYCRYFLDLAGDALRDDYTKSFIAALQRVITILETSQSKKGFLRKRQGTITKEEFREEREPKKNGIFSKPNQEG